MIGRRWKSTDSRITHLKRLGMVGWMPLVRCPSSGLNRCHPRRVKILERAERMGDSPTRPNALGDTLDANSGPCNVVLRRFRLFSENPVCRQIEFFDLTGIAGGGDVLDLPIDFALLNDLVHLHGSEKVKMAPPAAIATICRPFARYVIGLAAMVPPRLMRHSSLPLCASKAKK